MVNLIHLRKKTSTNFLILLSSIKYMLAGGYELNSVLCFSNIELVANDSVLCLGPPS